MIPRVFPLQTEPCHWSLVVVIEIVPVFLFLASELVFGDHSLNWLLRTFLQRSSYVESYILFTSAFG